MSGMKMPVKYVAEMFCDRIAASKTYNKEKYTDQDPLVYFLASKEHYLIHPDTKVLLEKLLVMLKEKGETATFRYIRQKLIKKGY